MASVASTDVLHPDELEGLGKDLTEARGLPARLYTDPEIFEAEKEKIFRREWMAVFHESSVPKPGDFRVVDLAGESLLFVRGEDGQLRCFHNICRHRGAKVASEREGNCRQFRCPYHTWTYDLHGTLLGAPEMAHVVREGIGLVEIRTEIWLGFVFVNQDGQAEPLASKLRGLNADLAPFLEAGDLEVLYEIPYPGHWNWKLTNENAYEGYHVIGSHFESAQWLIPGELTYTVTKDFRNYSDFFMPYAAGQSLRDTTGGSVAFDNLPAWVNEENRFYVIWPNIILFFSEPTIVAGITTPGAGPDQVTFTWTAAVRPETKQTANFERFKQEQIGFSNTIQGEDQYPCETMWANVHSGAFIPGPYAEQERCTYHFDQWYLGRMTA